MDVKASEIAGAVFVLYMLISSNFQAQLFPCRVQTILQESQEVKHLLGFLTMLFFVVLVNSKNKLSILELTVITSVAYLWFMMSTKMNHTVWFVMIFILGTIFVLQAYKDHQETEYQSNDEIKTIEKAQEVLSYVVAVVILIGFVIYTGEKRIEYGEEFKFMKFFVGNPLCKRESPNVNLRFALRSVIPRSRK